MAKTSPKDDKNAITTTTSPGMVLPLEVPMISTLGATGLKEYSGYITEDFLEKLQGRQAVRVYHEMSMNDPIVGAIIYACSMLMRRANWRVEPADDSAKAEQAQKFVEEVQDDMQHSWTEFIEEVTSYLTYGYSLFEVVYKIRGGSDTDDLTKKSKFDDGRFGIRKISPRSQDSVLRWLYDMNDKELVGVEQLTDKGERALIPMNKLLLFRTISTKENPEGKSILRNCYVSYVRKKAIEDAEGRAALRAAGIVLMRIPGRMMSAEADNDEKQVFNSFKALATTLSRDQQGAIILPSDRDQSGNLLYEMEYVVGDGRRGTDFSPIIRRFDEAMATSALADFIMLGQKSVGSHALSADKTDMFGQALSAYIKGVEDVLNRHLLPRLWELNNFDMEVMPKFKADAPEAPDLTTLGAYITALAGAGARMFPDEDLEEHLREVAELPPVAETAKAGLAAPKAPVGPDGKPMIPQGPMNGGPANGKKQSPQKKANNAAKKPAKPQK